MNTSAALAHSQQLLATYRESAGLYARQHALHGSAYAPPAIVFGLREACANIRRLKEALREQGVAVNDDINDNADLEIFSRDIGVGFSPHSKFALAQYDSYFDIWQSLQALRIAGDTLWENASRENIGQFAQQLRATADKIKIHQPFFEDAHYTALKDIVQRFGDFELGKVRLIDILTRQDEDMIAGSMAAAQIAQNRQIKERYEALLEQIGTSFRAKLMQFA